MARRYSRSATFALIRKTLCALVNLVRRRPVFSFCQQRQNSYSLLNIYCISMLQIVQVFPNNFNVFFPFLCHRLHFYRICIHESFPACAKLQLKIKIFYSIYLPRSGAVFSKKTILSIVYCKNIIQVFQPGHTKRPLPKEGPPVVCYAFQTGSLTWSSCSGSGSGR